MQTPLRLPDAWICWIKRLLIGGFIALAMAMIIFIVVTYQREHSAKVANLHLKGTVTEIFQPDHHNTKMFVARLSDSNSIVLEDAMRGVLQVGDSISKEKGEGFYTVKSRGTGKESRIRIFQP